MVALEYVNKPDVMEVKTNRTDTPPPMKPLTSEQNQNLVKKYFNNRADEFKDADFSGLQYLVGEENIGTILQKYKDVITKEDIDAIQTLVTLAEKDYNDNIAQLQSFVQSSMSEQKEAIVLGFGEDKNHQLGSQLSPKLSVDVEPLPSKEPGALDIPPRVVKLSDGTEITMPSHTEEQSPTNTTPETATSGAGNKETVESKKIDGTGIDIAQLGNAPEVKTYLVQTRKVVRELMSDKMQAQFSVLMKDMEPASKDRLQNMLRHGEILSEVMTDRQIDHLSLGLLGNMLEQVNAHWDDIESVVDDFAKQLPKILSYYQQHEASMQPLVHRIQTEGPDNPAVLGEVASMNAEHKEFIGEVAKNIDISPALQNMLEGFAHTPRHITEVIRLRVQDALGDVEMANATEKQLATAYEDALSLFDNYGETNAMIASFLKAGKEDVTYEQYIGKEFAIDNISIQSVEGVQNNINTLKPKVLAMKKKLEAQAGPFGLLQNKETRGKLNEFARFMSNGKHTNFISWFKETALGRLLLGGLKLFEIGTGQELFDFETIEDKDTVDYVTDLYSKNDKNTAEENNKFWVGSSFDNTKLDGISSRISYVRMEGGEKKTVFDKGEEIEGKDLEKIIKDDINMPLLGSAIQSYVADGKLDILYEAVHGVPLGKDQETNRDDIMKKYMETHFANTLTKHVGNKDDVHLHEAAIAKIITSDILQKKKLYEGMDDAVKDARPSASSDTGAVNGTPNPAQGVDTSKEKEGEETAE